MYFAKTLAIIALAAIGAQACNPGEYQCGKTNGAPGPDGSIQICDSTGIWRMSDQCGGGNCCQKRDTDAFCTC